MNSGQFLSPLYFTPAFCQVPIHCQVYTWRVKQICTCTMPANQEHPYIRHRHKSLWKLPLSRTKYMSKFRFNVEDIFATCKFQYCKVVQKHSESMDASPWQLVFIISWQLMQQRKLYQVRECYLKQFWRPSPCKSQVIAVCSQSFAWKNVKGWRGRKAVRSRELHGVRVIGLTAWKWPRA